MADDSEEHTPTEVAVGSTSYDGPFNWCSWCGCLWKPVDWCQCHPDGLRGFPEELAEAVAVARRLQGHAGVWAIEQELWQAQRHPVQQLVRCDERTEDGRQCRLQHGHNPKYPPNGHVYDGVEGKTCTCMLRWHPNRCKAHPECNQ